MNIGFVGLGCMGRGLCFNLLKHGHHLKVYNRSKEPVRQVASWGAQAVEHVEEAASGVDILFFCLSSAEAQKRMMEQGVLDAMNAGTPFFDLGTWSVEVAGELEELARRHGIEYAGLPMGRGPEAAAAGKTPFFYGGSRKLFENWRPLLDEMGEASYLGSVSQAYIFKLVTQSMGLTNNITIGEGILLARKLHLDSELIREVVLASEASSYQFWNSSERLLHEVFEPVRAPLNICTKDMAFGLDLADKLGVSVPFFALARKRYEEAREAGWGEQDFSSVYKLLLKDRRGDRKVVS